MNPLELMSFAKFASAASSGNVTKADVENEIRAMMLKNMVDNVPYWDQQQKYVIKLSIDIAKENHR